MVAEMKERTIFWFIFAKYLNYFHVLWLESIMMVLKYENLNISIECVFFITFLLLSPISQLLME